MTAGRSAYAGWTAGRVAGSGGDMSGRYGGAARARKVAGGVVPLWKEEERGAGEGAAGRWGLVAKVRRGAVGETGRRFVVGARALALGPRAPALPARGVGGEGRRPCEREEGSRAGTRGAA